MLKVIQVQTSARTDFVNITGQVQSFLQGTGMKSGLVTVYVPHTTCAVTINESADPDVVRDITSHLAKVIPVNGGFHHYEGNSDSHIKTSLVGTSETIIVDDGQLLLGTWQGIFLCDFDGPRTRKVYLKATADAG